MTPAIKPQPEGKRALLADCHGAAAGRTVVDAPTIALVGCPNVGKSAVFRLLTGIRAGVGNYPGTTVDIGRGVWRVAPGRQVNVLDLPGTYSLDPMSPDEQLVHDLLVMDSPDLVIAVVDAVNLARSLYLVAQLREQSGRVIVVLTMTDVLGRRGHPIDVGALRDAIGVPVVTVDGRSGGVPAELGEATVRALAGAPTPARQVGDQFAGVDPQLAAAAERFEWVRQVEQLAMGTGASSPKTTGSDRVDQIVCNRWLGPIIFLAAMFGVFMITTKAAAPLQEWLAVLVEGPVTSGLATFFGWFGWADGVVASFVIDGVVTGVGAVLTFIPLMIIMFGLLALLEDSGYMARAAVVADRLMRAVGLPGRAFIPMIVGFGCNVPAVAATRVIPNARHRLLTVLLLPFVSCNARLTVYVLVGTVFFGANAGYVVFAMYVLSVVLVVVVGRLLRGVMFRDISPEPLLIDLPPYHLPMPRLVAAVTWQRLRAFLRTATGIIVITSAAVWVLSATPAIGIDRGADGASDTAGFGQVSVADSLYGQVSQAVAPVFDPAGFGNWEATSALITGFVAKEAVIAAWAQTYATDEPADERDPGELGALLQADFEESSGGHAAAAVLAFMVFLLAYTPCLTTLAAQRREIGMRWTLFGVGVQLVVAWTLAVAVFQIGRLL
ncbi:MAG: ferrous iron transport protein B [Candidatus Nanopelagicales bacterium]|nr:ferrous iron transport protein B [Candidatus Nanopelagicales bacterium]